MPEWTEIVKEIYVMEQLTFSLRPESTKFGKYWQKWILYQTAKLYCCYVPISFREF
ncbi:hypothetical protein LDENG_00226650 [Lucifuga dentata]|nr:hypothetical protein LDENG_00226650 [Lucifuga dentata]